MSDPLAECRHKIVWADKHRQLLQAKFSAFVDDQANRVIGEYDCEQAKYLFKLHNPKLMQQTEWGLILGDCVHNARSALDYIAWRLGGSRLKDRSTLFPICLTEAKFKDRVKARHLKRHIHPDALVEISHFQPYHRSKPEEHPLWLLEELDARDKHKLLTMVQTVTYGGHFRQTGQVLGKLEVIHRECALKDSAIVAEISYPIGTPEAEVEVYGKPMFGVAFERGILPPNRNFSVLQCLEQIIQGVKETISYFEALLVQHPDWPGWVNQNIRPIK